MYEFLRYRVKHVMNAAPVTIAAGSTLAEADAVFERRDFNALPVVDGEGRLLGMLTRLDVLAAFAFTPESVIPHYEEIMQRAVDTCMTRDAVAVDPELPLTRVLARMVETRLRSLPVLADGRLVGMIARRDVLRALRQAVAGEGPPGG